MSSFLDHYNTTNDISLVEALFNRHFYDVINPIIEKVVQADKTQPYKLSGDTEAKYEQILSFVNTVKKELDRGLKKLAKKNGKVYINVKKLNSFKDKVENRKQDAHEITDVLRSTITFKSAEDLDEAVKSMKKVFKIARYDKKEVKQDKDYGYYGSHHFLVKLSNGLVAEVQLMTHKFFAFKVEGHKYYEKWRSAMTDMDKWSKEKKAEFDKDKKASKAIYAKANR